LRIAVAEDMQIGCTAIASRRPVLWAAVRDCASGQTLVPRLYDGTSCKLMATLGVVVNGLGNLEAVLPAASALAKRHVNYGVKAADYTPVGAALLWTLEHGLRLE
jgi:hypothetical protein